MVQSFSATHFCRICTASKLQTQNMISEDSTLLRKWENASGVSTPELGIKIKCLLDELNYFKIFDCPTVDIMHDILEGVGSLEIKLFLKFVVKDLKLITNEKLNDRIKNFNYGKIEITNKPSPINLDKVGSLLGQRAGQAWCLIRFPPLILSDIIKQDSAQPKWKIVRLLLRIMQIVFSPIITPGMTTELEWLIEEHHAIFISEFKRGLIPKHHFMIHYARIIRIMGPLISLWCMRFEAKHNYFKNLVHKFHNFKNITKTLAEQHQRYMFYEWKCRTSSLLPEIESGKGDLSSYKQFIENFYPEDDYSQVKDSDIINIVDRCVYLYEYRVGFFITTGFDENTDLPVFFLIKKIFIFNDNIYALCKAWTTLAFDEDFHAFEIMDSDCTPRVININSLRHKIPYEYHQPYHCTSLYIVPKSQII